MSDQEIVDKLELVWGSIAALCEPLSERDWKLATDCPKWSVQDHVSHIVGTESRLAGRPVPDHTPEEMGHVHNDIGRGNEIWVDFLRSRTGGHVLEAFREVTATRLQRLRGMSADDFSEPTQTPVGPGTVRDFMVIRIFDCWVHEQDIRRAVGRPGHMEGPVVIHSMDRMVRAMPFVVGKKAAAPDGSTVVFDITGPAGRTVAIGVQGGRAAFLESTAAAADVRLTMNVEAFTCLGNGRWEGSRALGMDKVGIDGNRELGERIVAGMNFMV
ncbi:MAG: maleylpyruvate isomerase family mycothiol-dependent enzyme [Candidatus Tectomicrobia bacterium]|nr:maleylpyruvate isomerase family mycothiol-dependent enzyme [Candidatus Tectomicrobia bacterium]